MSGFFLSILLGSKFPQVLHHAFPLMVTIRNYSVSRMRAVVLTSRNTFR